MHTQDTKLDTTVLYPGIHLGVIEDNADPLNQGRCRVRILGFHSPEKTFNGEDGMAISDLPWAIPANPIQGGSISGLGWSGVPVLGSHVCLFFIGGDHNYPVYFATIAGIYKSKPDIKLGFSDPTGTYPKEINKPDFNSLASPTNTVFETPNNGVRVEYDSTPSSEKYKVTLKVTNGIIEIDSAGNIKLTSSMTKLNSNAVMVENDLSVGNGASGSFITASGQVVSVVEGIVVNII